MLKRHDQQAKPFEFPPSAGTSQLHLEYHRGRPEVYYHYHPQFELLLVRGGGGRRIVGDDVTDYTGRDLVLIGPNLAHSWIAEDDDTDGDDFHVAVFTRDAIGMEFLARQELSGVENMLRSAQRGLFFPEAAIEHVEQKLTALHELPPSGKLLQFLLVLAELAEEGGRPVASAAYAESAGQADQQRFHTVLQFIHEHFQDSPSLTEAARSVHMSVPTFTRFFKRMTGQTFVAYLNGWRIRRACSLLISSDESIVNIAGQAGFGNLSHFNRQFHRLTGTTPRQYRRRYST
ncbi:MAG: helix-turn-helix domain-containing protein [Phycisphaerae bacterium]